MALTENDFNAAAKALGVNAAAIKAVTAVESAGGGFLADGRVKIQYEPHIMYQRLKTNLGKAKADKALASYPDLVAISAGSYQSLDKEDKDMARAAAQIDRDSALESASWGLFQIMGYHWKTLGYSSLQAFVNEMYSGEAGQLAAFVKFIKADPRLEKALRAKDWTTFARIYNGPGYVKNQYDVKLKAAYEKFSK